MGAEPHSRQARRESASHRARAGPRGGQASRPGLRRARAGMRLLLDENISDRRLAARLRAQGHDPVLATGVGLLSATDARVFIAAITQALGGFRVDLDMAFVVWAKCGFCFVRMGFRRQGARAWKPMRLDRSVS